MRNTLHIGPFAVTSVKSLEAVTGQGDGFKAFVLNS